MPVRHFDGRRVRAVRRAADLSQIEVARAMGLSSTGTVASWEGGAARPGPEKLPALAQALGAALDDLFPRQGPPDLADLRSDAGYSQYQTRQVLGTKSAGPVANAERGRRRLPERFTQPLADAYGVSVEQLLAAQERSFGHTAPEDARTDPSGDTSALKISNLLRTATGSNEDIAKALNAYLAGMIVTAPQVAQMRAGGSRDLSPEVVRALAAVFDVPTRSLLPDGEAVREIAQELQTLASLRHPPISHLAMRGGGGQLNERLVSAIADLLEDIDNGTLPGADATDLD